eukprot:TRINITY_DN9204_c0_g2_i1.p1 TRINITY_DN9204_c0_g2~~TRINITY_DN9204_c0_g2_i1.p1  ORF type:complete len:1484 (+),score=275.22 TRINITY_DN9204_c0_g2_i1:49-4452(+)
MNTLSEVARHNDVPVEHHTIVLSNPRKSERWRVDPRPGELAPGTEIKIARDVLFLSGLEVRAGDEGKILKNRFEPGDSSVFNKDNPDLIGTVKSNTIDSESRTLTVTFPNGDQRTAPISEWDSTKVTIFLHKHRTYFQGDLRDVITADTDLVVDIYSPVTRQIQEDVSLSNLTLKPRTRHNLQIRRGLVRKSSRTVRDIISYSFKYFEASPAILLKMSTTAGDGGTWLSYGEVSLHVCGAASHFPKPGTFVLLTGCTSIPQYLAYLAALYNQNVLVPLPANMPTDYVKQVVQETCPSLVLGDTDVLRKWSRAGVELNCKIAVMDEAVPGKQFAWDEPQQQQQHLDCEPIGYHDIENIHNWFCSSVKETFDRQDHTELDLDTLGELHVSGLKTFPIYTSPVFALTETDLLVDSSNDLVMRLSSVCRNRTTGFVSRSKDDEKVEEEIVFTLLDDNVLQIQGDTVFWTGRKNDTSPFWEGTLTLYKDTSNEKQIPSTLSKYNDIDIKQLCPDSNTITDTAATTPSQYYPKAGAALERVNTDESDGPVQSKSRSTLCTFCKNLLHPRKSGKLTPLICMDCTKYIGYKSTESMGCINCNVACCESCFHDKSATSVEWLKKSENKPALILYTSGSTGVPKGAILPAKSLVIELVEGLSKSNLDRVVLLTGSMAVSSVPSKIIGCLAEGGRIAVDDQQDLLVLAKHVGPTGLSVVPQIATSMYKAFQSSVQKGEDIEAVRERFSQTLGPRIRVLNCGGAKPNAEVMEWMRSVFRQSVITENYATTEVGPISFCDGQGTERRTTVNSNVEVKLVDWNDYRSTDIPHPRGELCVKSPFMVTGYLNRPDLTRESFDEDGFFHTGDICILEQDEESKTQYITVIDRKKSFCKLANGEWVTPEIVEAVLCQNEAALQAFVYGTSTDHAVVAIVVTTTPTGSKDSEASEKVITSLIDDCRNSNKLRPCEVPSAILLLPPSDKFTTSNELLTITEKLCRPKLRDRYEAEIDLLRSEGRTAFDSTCDDVITASVNLLRNIVQNSITDEHESKWMDLIESELAASSIKCVQVCMAARLQLGVEIPPGQLIGRLPLRQIQCDLEGGRGKTMTEEEIINDVHRIYKEYIDEGSGTGTTDHPPTDGLVVITGASGFLGLSIVHKAIQHYGLDRVVVFVRPQSRSKFTEGLRRRTSSYSEIPRIVCCDLTDDDFGIEPDTLLDLKSKTSVVINSAASVNHLASYTTLRDDNVVSVARLMCHFKNAKFVHISSLSAGCDGGGYGSTKFAAEKLIELSKRPNAHIVRPGMIGPDRKSGVSNMSDWFIRYIHGCLIIGSFKDPNNTIVHLTEVGYCAECVIAVSSGKYLSQSAISTVPSSPLSIKMMFEAINASLLASNKQPLTCVSDPFTWSQILGSLPSANPMFPFKSLFSKGMPPVESHVADNFPTEPPLYDKCSLSSMVESIYFNSDILSDAELLMKTLSDLSGSM